MAASSVSEGVVGGVWKKSKGEPETWSRRTDQRKEETRHADEACDLIQHPPPLFPFLDAAANTHCPLPLFTVLGSLMQQKKRKKNPLLPKSWQAHTLTHCSPMWHQHPGREAAFSSLIHCYPAAALTETIEAITSIISAAAAPPTFIPSFRIMKLAFCTTDHGLKCHLSWKINACVQP